MINERTLELINAAIDGELGPGEQAELDAILESYAEARAMNAELLKLTNLMEGLPAQQPPVELASQVLQQIKLPAKKASFFGSGWLPSIQPAAVGAAFAAGLVVTVAFYEISSDRPVSDDAASMGGTMIAGQQEPPGFLKNDMVLNGEGFSGTISLRENSGIYVLNFDLNSETGTEVEVGLDDTGYAFGGFAEVQGNADKVVESVSMSGGTLRVVNQGHQQFAVFLREGGVSSPAPDGSISIDFK